MINVFINFIFLSFSFLFTDLHNLNSSFYLFVYLHVLMIRADWFYECCHGILSDPISLGFTCHIWLQFLMFK